MLPRAQAGSWHSIPLPCPWVRAFLTDRVCSWTLCRSSLGTLATWRRGSAPGARKTKSSRIIMDGSGSSVIACAMGVRSAKSSKLSRQVASLHLRLQDSTVVQRCPVQFPALRLRFLRLRLYGWMHACIYTYMHDCAMRAMGFCAGAQPCASVSVRTQSPCW